MVIKHFLVVALAGLVAAGSAAAGSESATTGMTPAEERAECTRLAEIGNDPEKLENVVSSMSREDQLRVLELLEGCLERAGYRSPKAQ